MATRVTGSVLSGIYGQIAGIEAMRSIDAFVQGDPEAVERYKRYKETGEAPAIIIDSIEAAEEGNGHADYRM